MTTTIEAPRAPRSVRRRGINWEKWGWVYMRASGVVLVVLIFGHLFVNLMIGDGVKALDFAFVGGKLSSPFWQVWDTLLLWLALIHGANGMRTITTDDAPHRLVGRRGLEDLGRDLREQAGQARELLHRPGAGRASGQVPLELQAFLGQERPEDVGPVEVGELATHATTPLSSSARRSARSA